MMKRKVALLMTTVMLATSVFPAGITACAEEAVPTSEIAVEATLDETLEETLEESVDASVEDEVIADDTVQDALTEDDSNDASIASDEDVIVSDVEVVDEASTVEAQDSRESEIKSISITVTSKPYPALGIAPELQKNLTVEVQYEGGTTERISSWQLPEEDFNRCLYGETTGHGDKIVVRLETVGGVTVNYPYGEEILVPGKYKFIAYADGNADSISESEVFEVTNENTVDLSQNVKDYPVKFSGSEPDLNLFRFVPPENGYYNFHLSTDINEYDGYLYLYNSLSQFMSGQEVWPEAESKEASTGIIYLEKGQTYYYVVYSRKSTQDIYATVQFSRLIVESLTLKSPPKKTTFEIGENGTAWIDVTGMEVCLDYSDPSVEDQVVSPGESDGYGNFILCGYCPLKDDGSLDLNNLEYEYSDKEGTYALVAEVMDEDNWDVKYRSGELVKITVAQRQHVHSWLWTTTKNADIYGPATQTGRCTCGATTTRTIGSKLAPVLTLTANKLTMKTKQSTSKFKVEAMAAGDALASVTSNNTKLLKVSNVSPNGTFKLKAQNKTGTAKLTITLKSGTSKTIKVKIQKAKVNTTKIKVASKKLTLSKKQKYNLAAAVTPVTSYDKVKYTSSNKKVATVSKKGQVTAKNKGSATITVKSGKKSVKVKVTVK